MLVQDHRVGGTLTRDSHPDWPLCANHMPGVPPTWGPGGSTHGLPPGDPEPPAWQPWLSRAWSSPSSACHGCGSDRSQLPGGM